MTTTNETNATPILDEDDEVIYCERCEKPAVYCLTGHKPGGSVKWSATSCVKCAEPFHHCQYEDISPNVTDYYGFFVYRLSDNEFVGYAFVKYP